MIGILGGTFDPVHYGHLRTAWELCESLDMKELRLLPCRQPPHRGEPAATPEQRLAMLERALAGQDRLRIDTRELERPGPSYMVDTLASLRGELGRTPFALVLGADAFAGLADWHRWERLIELAHLVVVTRPDGPPSLPGPVAALLEHCRVADAAALRSAQAGGILETAVTPLAISATAIRAQVAAGRSPRYLLPDAVLAYIEEEGLYRVPERTGR